MKVSRAKKECSGGEWTQREQIKESKTNDFLLRRWIAAFFLSAYPQRLGCKDCSKAKSRNARKARNSCCWIQEKTLKDVGG